MQKDFSSIPLTDEFQEFMETEKSMACLILNRAAQRGGKTALRWYRNGKWYNWTWAEFREQVRAAAKALMHLGIGEGAMVGIFSHNRPEWHIADIAICSTRAASVPIYATNSAQEARYIATDADLKVVFVGNQEQYDRIMQFFYQTNLKKVIAIDPAIEISGEHSVHFADFLARGRRLTLDEELDAAMEAARPDDIFTLIYTSGTTGNPKGAIHSNESFMAGIFATSYRFPDMGPDMVSLSFLPLSHVYERMWAYGAFVFNLENHYCEDPKAVADLLPVSRPHYLCTVPRIWEKFYAAIYDKMASASALKKKLFDRAVQTAHESYREKSAGREPGPILKARRALAEALVLKKLRAMITGGRAETFHVGGAVCPHELKVFFNSIGIPLCEGFGLTEFFPVCVGRPDLAKDDYCGPVIPMVETKTSEEGELLLRGKNVMQGYYKRPQATAECFTEDNWYRTGDVAEIHQEGNYTYIRITDRIKDIIITAGGKNILPQQIEGLFGGDRFVEQIAVVGENRRYLSALIVPAFEVLEEYARENNIAFSSRENLVERPEIRDLYAARIEERTRWLGQVEKIKNFTLLTKEFSQEDGEITPTFKVKRKVLDEKYKDVIDRMY